MEKDFGLDKAMEELVIADGVLKQYLGKDEHITIPKDVKKIAARAFYGNSTLKEISFDTIGLNSIDEYAFYGCIALESVYLPDGILNIGDYAFFGCSSLKYARIPKSVFLIGEKAFDETPIIIGEKETEAEKYAIANSLKYSEHECLITGMKKEKKTERESRSFSVFGENVTVSDSLIVYETVYQYYQGEEKEVFDCIAKLLPDRNDEDSFKSAESFVSKFGTLPDFLRKFFPFVSKTTGRLANKGIFRNSEKLFLDCNEQLIRIGNLYLPIITSYCKFATKRADAVSKNTAILKAEAQSKVTGLSYGVIGGPLDLAAHEIDDYRARQEQRESARKEMLQKNSAFLKWSQNELNKEYGALLDQKVPLLKKAIKDFTDKLFSVEISELGQNGFLNEDEIKGIDIAKSEEMLAKARKGKETERNFLVAKSLQFYPCNKKTLEYAVESGLADDEIESLIEYNGLRDTISKNIKAKRIADLEKEKERKLNLLKKQLMNLERDLEDKKNDIKGTRRKWCAIAIGVYLFVLLLCAAFHDNIGDNATLLICFLLLFAPGLIFLIPPTEKEKAELASIEEKIMKVSKQKNELADEYWRKKTELKRSQNTKS